MNLRSPLLDLKKAFDSVPHNKLLYRLWRTGITGRWFKVYGTAFGTAFAASVADRDDVDLSFDLSSGGCAPDPLAHGIHHHYESWCWD